ncbi:hypothetical protein C8R46DRAFT_1307795 [Mycena filopes]|nr:hypothetical protein C8R46DRAFT_1307795 [Mycena filopes]
MASENNMAVQEEECLECQPPWPYKQRQELPMAVFREDLSENDFDCAQLEVLRLVSFRVATTKHISAPVHVTVTASLLPQPATTKSSSSTTKYSSFEKVNMTAINPTQLLLETTRKAISESFPAKPYPEDASAAIKDSILRDGAAGINFAHMKLDGERTFRLLVTIKLYHLLPAHLLDTSLLEALGEEILAALAHGNGSGFHGVSAVDFFLGIVQYCESEHADDEAGSVFIDECLGGLWTALSDACGGLPVVIRPAEASRVNALAEQFFH